MEPPHARAIRDDSRFLASPPRNVPTSLWLGTALGGVLAQSGWLCCAFVGWLAAAVAHYRSLDDDFPLPLLLFPALIGLVPIAIAGRRARRQLRLLRHGVPTHGTLVDKREVANSETSFWHYTFEYRIAAGTTHRTTVITDVPEKTIEDDALEPMLYNPDVPDHATPLDHLPGNPAIVDGQLVARKGIAALLILPIAALASVLALLVA